VSVTATSSSKFTVTVVGLSIVNGSNWNPTSGETHFKIGDSTTGAFSGVTFAELQEKFAVVVTGFAADQNLGGFYLNVDDSGDLEIVYVPEPTGATALVAVGAAALSRRGRRRASAPAEGCFGRGRFPLLTRIEWHDLVDQHASVRIHGDREPGQVSCPPGLRQAARPVKLWAKTSARE
jgi:hypothetical protein